jgi:hypothetical protein
MVNIYMSSKYLAPNIFDFIFGMHPKRNRNPLASNYRESLSSSKKPKNESSSYYLKTKARGADLETIVSVSQRTVKARVGQYEVGPSPHSLHLNAEPPEQHALQPGMAEERRHAVKYLFCQVFGSPPKDTWAAYDVIWEIMSR